MESRRIVGDCRTVLRQMIADGVKVQCVVSSPPYWGLRDYGTATWEGGDGSECDHRVPGSFAHSTLSVCGHGESPEARARREEGQRQPYKHNCLKCGARRVDAQIGLESLHDCLGWATGNRCGECHVCHMVEVFRLVREVLADEGTCWINLGDSYANAGQAGGGDPTIGTRNLGGARQPKLVVPPGLKPKDLCGMPWRVALALQSDGWWLRSDIIWCLSGGARVYVRSQKGDMPMSVKDLVRLDPATVKLWNGEKWTQALGWSRSSETHEESLEIELRSGERIGCTPGHQWPTHRGNVAAEELRLGDVIKTCRLPAPDRHYNPQYIDHDVGWIAGLYLAEGSRDPRGRLQFSGHSNENGSRERAMRRVVEAFGGRLFIRQAGNIGLVRIDCRALSAIISEYVHGDSAATKGIRVRAWRHTDEWLRSFLNGYLIGDGHYDVANDRWRLGFTRNDRLAADLRTISARLGCSLTLKATHGKGFGKVWPIYHGELRMDPSDHHNAKDRGEVVGIRASKARQHWDIGVADDPHLFALASGVLTHNSKANPMPESVTDRPTRSHEYLFLLAKKSRYFYDAEAVREPGNDEKTMREVERQRRIRAAGTLTTPADVKSIEKIRGGENFVPNGRNRRTVWTIDDDFISQPGYRIRDDITDEQMQQFLSQYCEPVEVVADRPAHGHEYLFLLAKKSRYFYDAEAVREKGIDEPGTHRGGSLASAFNGRPGDPKVSAHNHGGGIESLLATGYRNKRTVWAIATEPFSAAHFATFPKKLVEPAILAGTSTYGHCPAILDSGKECGARWERVVEREYVRPATQRGYKTAVDRTRYDGQHESGVGYRPDAVLNKQNTTTAWRPTCGHNLEPVPDIVLDPFFGSGTVGLVAEQLGRKYIGIELNPNYSDLAREDTKQEVMRL